MRWFVAVTLCAGLLHAQQGDRQAIYSAEKEAALGAEYAAEMRRNAHTLDAPEVRAWVEQVGLRLAPALTGTTPVQWNFDIVVADDTAHDGEAYAFPGGLVFVPTALLLKAKDEAEFAGMLAHSMAHIVARHWIREARRSGEPDPASIPLVYMGGWTGFGGRHRIIPAAFMPTARDFEFEADKMAAQAMAQAGYDPAALREYIRREQADAAAPEASALPPREERLAALEGYHPAIRPQPPTGQFPAIQEVVRSAVSQVSRRQIPTLDKK